MSGFTREFKADITNHMLRGERWSPPRKLYLALLLSEASSVLGMREVEAEEYERVEIELRHSEDGTAANANDILFPMAASEWGEARAVGLCDAKTGGRVLVSAPRLDQRVIKWPERIHYAPDKLVFTFKDD